MTFPRLDYKNLRRTLRELDYPFFDDGDYNLNIIGIRTEDSRANLFNDWICLAFRQNGHEQLLVFSATTDPGIYWRKHPMNVEGTAILKAGHYPGMFSLGMHQGKYLALRQSAPCTVYRDANQDANLDTGPGLEQETGMFGINLHRATSKGASEQVDRWSAGCQVIACSSDFDLFLEICKRGAKEFGARFSYTLLNEYQVWK